jgi:hypothetical protein
MVDYSSNRINGKENHNLFKHFQWNNKFWLQGPRYSKSLNMSVQINKMALLINSAVESIEKLHEKNIEDKLVCPGQSVSTLEVNNSSETIMQIMDIYVSSMKVQSVGYGWHLAFFGGNIFYFSKCLIFYFLS